MKKRASLFLGAVFLATLIAGCGSAEKETSESGAQVERPTSAVSSSLESSQIESVPTKSPAASSPKASSQIPEQQTVESSSTVVQGTQLQIMVGDQVFLGKLAEIQAANSLAEMFPMTLGMSDWKSVAKSFVLPSALPEEPETVTSLQPGQLVLGESGELLLFYGEYTQGGDFTLLATVEDPEGLAEALEGQSVEVSFQMTEG